MARGAAPHTARSLPPSANAAGQNTHNNYNNNNNYKSLYH